MLNNDVATPQNLEPGSYIPDELNPRGFESVVDVLADASKRFTNLPAFTSVGCTLTYGELKQKADAFTAYLQRHTDLKPGDRIAVQLPNVVQFPVVVFGAMQAGLIVVNTNPLYTPKELEHQFNDAGVKAVVVFANMAANVEKIIAKTQISHVLITEIADFHRPVKRLLINSIVKHVKKMVPAYNLPQSVSLNDAIALGAKSRPDIMTLNRTDLAVLQYTGGTTGVAKGAMLTHANLISNMHQLKNRLDHLLEEGNETFIAPLPLYHIYAFLIHAMTLVEYGAHTILIPNPRDLPNFVKELNKWKFTGFIGLNTLFAGLCNREDFAKVDFSSLKLTASGGMPLTHAAADRWKSVTGCTVSEGYGLTETSPVVAFNPIGKEQIGTIGLAVDCTDIRIIDDNGNDVVPGEPGMLCVKGPQVMKGYWHREQATQDVMTPDGFLITGDVATQQADGYLSIVDRAKDLIIVSGFNVYPTEVEDVITQHPDVLEAAAIGVDDDKTGEAVKAFLVLKDGAQMDEKAMHAFCKENLAAYKVPRQYEVRKELPKTNVGKILRRALREPEH